MRVLVLAALVATAAAAPAAAQSGSTPPRDSSQVRLSLPREVFSYSGTGRRDPMVSLMNTGDIRPLLSEVDLVAIVFDETGSNHQAVLRNNKDKKTQYRVKTGSMLGRMRITQITRREVVFTLNEFGFSRQERLSVRPDTTAARTP
jgi:hypothetical protein